MHFHLQRINPHKLGSNIYNTKEMKIKDNNIERKEQEERRVRG